MQSQTKCFRFGFSKFLHIQKKLAISTLLLISLICALRDSESVGHVEPCGFVLLAHAFFKASLHSAILHLISLLSSTHCGAQPFLERILYSVSSAGSACGFVLMSRGFPLPGRFSKWPSSMDRHIRCSTTFTISVSDLPACTGPSMKGFAQKNFTKQYQITSKILRWIA